MLLFAAIAAAALGAVPVEIGDGISIAVPEGMQRLSGAAFEQSRALVPEPPTAAGGVIAVFAESGEGGASLVVGKVGSPLAMEVAARQDLAEAVARHFRADLDLEVVVDRPVLLEGPQRLEVRASTRVGTRRVVRFAFVPSGEGQLVVAFSMAASREEELDPLIREVFDSVVAPAPVPRSSRLAVRAAAFGAAGLLLVVGWQLWRKRLTRRRQEG